MRILLTGAAGKVGSNLLPALLERRADAAVVALCHNRLIPETSRVSVVRGNIADRSTAESAMAGVTHVVHMATCKDTPDEVMDVAVKGMFWLLEAFRQNPSARQFILIGGDASVGHFFYPHADPVTEKTPHMAYPGCYALSKVLEEVMLEQYRIQYGLNTCCLRAPWIMEKDDFRYSLSFGDDIFGGQDWKSMVDADTAGKCRSQGAIPLLQDAQGKPVKRNFVHVEDLVEAILLALDNPVARGKLYNICMDEPIDYGEVAQYLERTRGLPSIAIKSPYHSNWMDNSKAKFDLGWAPRHDTGALVEAAWSYQRAAGDPRKVWYPG
jgi:UDP-glucose 4-epimerase